VELASGRVGVDLEIKNIPGDAGFESPREAALEAALRELETASFSGDVLISSFNWLTIERSRELAPDIPPGFLTIAPIEPRAEPATVGSFRTWRRSRRPALIWSGKLTMTGSGWEPGWWTTSRAWPRCSNGASTRWPRTTRDWRSRCGPVPSGPPDLAFQPFPE